MTWPLLGIKTADYSQRRTFRATSLNEGRSAGGYCGVAFGGGGASAVLDKIMLDEIEDWLRNNCVGWWARRAAYSTVDRQGSFAYSTVDRLGSLAYSFENYEDAALFFLRFR